MKNVLLSIVAATSILVSSEFGDLNLTNQTIEDEEMILTTGDGKYESIYDTDYGNLDYDGVDYVIYADYDVNTLTEEDTQRESYTEYGVEIFDRAMGRLCWKSNKILKIEKDKENDKIRKKIMEEGITEMEYYGKYLLGTDFDIVYTCKVDGNVTTEDLRKEYMEEI